MADRADGLRANVSRSMVELTQDIQLQRFLGELTDHEVRQTVTTSLSVPRDVLLAVDRIVSDPRAGYATRSEFIRHGVHALLIAWLDAGYPDQQVYDVTMHARAMREAAMRIRVRADFEEAITAYEVQLNDGAELGDWGLVRRTLETLQGYIEGSPDPYWKEQLRRTVARNGAVKRAASAMWEAFDDRGKRDPERKEAVRWQSWVESLGE